MSFNARTVIDEIRAEREKQRHALDCAALTKLAEWHEMQSRYPGDVAGSDRNRYQRSKFHAEAALDIRTAIAEIESLETADHHDTEEN